MTEAAFGAPAHLLLLLAALAGFMFLALAMSRPQSDLFGRELAPATNRLLRLAGCLCLLTALWFSISRMGWGFGLTAYSGHTSAAAAMVFMALLISGRLQELRQQREKARALAAKAATAQACNAVEQAPL